jgi:hypothetical protein
MGARAGCGFGPRSYRVVVHGTKTSRPHRWEPSHYSSTPLDTSSMLDGMDRYEDPFTIDYVQSVTHPRIRCPHCHAIAGELEHGMTLETVLAIADSHWYDCAAEGR